MTLKKDKCLKINLKCKNNKMNENKSLISNSMVIIYFYITIKYFLKILTISDILLTMRCKKALYEYQLYNEIILIFLRIF